MSEEKKDISIFKIGPTPTGQVLYFFGARHTNDPGDTQFAELKRFWDEFLNISKTERVVFTEGTIRVTLPKYEDSIIQHGETGAMQWLANESSVTCVCPEPDSNEQRRVLCTSFDPKLVAYTMIAQNLTSWYRHTNQSSFDEALNKVIEREAKLVNIYGFVIDKTWFYDQHEKLFGKQKLEDKYFLDLISDPRKSETVVNTVVASRTKMRNEYVSSVLNKEWKLGKSIFIVYGKGHFTAFENLLDKII